MVVPCPSVEVRGLLGLSHALGWRISRTWRNAFAPGVAGAFSLGRRWSIFRRAALAALVGQLVAVVSELVTPILSRERPELVLVVDIDRDDVSCFAVAFLGTFAS